MCNTVNCFKMKTLVMIGLPLLTMLQVRCSGNIGPVFNKIDDLNNEVVEMKRALFRVEENVINQIDYAKLAIKSELKQDITQHVQNSLSEILKGEALEKMITDQFVSEMRQLKRRQLQIKKQLRQVLKSLSDVQQDRDNYKDALQKSQKKSNELKCIVISEDAGRETKTPNTSCCEDSILTESVTAMSKELQSVRTEQSVIKTSLETTEQTVMSTESAMSLVWTSLNATKEDLLSVKSELSSVKRKIEIAESETKKQTSNKTSDPVIAFKAHMSANQIVSRGETLTFDDVVTNIGNGYNPHSGVFVTPVTGMYLLSVIIGTQGPGAGDFALGTQRNTEAYIVIKSDWYAGAMTTLAHLNEGERVFVTRTVGGAKELRGWRLTQFAGFLLRAD